MSDQDRAHSVTPKADVATNSGKRLGQVRYELGLILFAVIPYWLFIEKVVSDATSQLLYLLVYGVVSAAWLVLRTRRVLNRLQDDKANHGQD